MKYEFDLPDGYRLGGILRDKKDIELNGVKYPVYHGQPTLYQSVRPDPDGSDTWRCNVSWGVYKDRDYSCCHGLGRTPQEAIDDAVAKINKLVLPLDHASR